VAVDHDPVADSCLPVLIRPGADVVDTAPAPVIALIS